MPTAPPDPTRFVLVQPSHAGNVGAAARAMKVMGFADLVLVAPRFADVLQQPETVSRASGAAEILARARVVPTLAEALHGITWACATAMTPRDFGPPAASPRAHFEMLLKKELLALDGKGLEVKNASNIEAPAAETLASALISALDVARASHDRISNERQPPESSAEAAARRLPQRPRASRSES